MPVNFRDVQFKQDKRFGEKIDRTKVIKGVIVDSLGNDSGSGDIWADRLSRRVWVRELGTAGSSQVPCYNIEPVIGLGVILGYEIGSNTREVLRTDKEFFGPTNPTGTSYESPSLTDFLPGGRFALWVASKMITPLSTYPSSTGLSVNVVAGDYPYAGTRKTFTGQTGFALTQNPNAGQHYYAGLYLDSANTLQVVYGASVVLATTPPEPSWPAGAFRLSVVRVNDTQTGITLAQDTSSTNDILDRRMPWSDEATHNLLSATHPDTLTGSVVAGDIVYGNSTPKWARLPKGSNGQVLTLAAGLPSWAAAASGGWPFAHVLTVSTTDPDAQYATLAAANAAAAPGDVILLDAETYTLTATETLADAGLTIMGRGPQATIITNSVASGAALYANAANITLRNLTIRHTGAGISAGGVFVDASGLTLDNVIIEKTSGVPTVGYGLWLFDGTGHRLTNGTKITCTTGTSAYGIRNTNATITATVEGGRIEGTTFDIFGDQAGSTLTLVDPVLVNASKSYSGTLRGEAFDQYGRRLRIKPIGVSDGRLTLTTTVPVTNADVTAAATIYYTPYVGGECEVYNGSFWIEAPFAEVSLSLSGFTVDKNSDLWIYDNAGTLALERTEWTNDTARATALAVQDGRYCKSGALTRLYIGTFRTSATGQCEDSKLKRFVWNNYNRVPRMLIVQELTNTWTYTLVAWRQANGSAANQVAVVIGWNEDALRLTAVGNATKDDAGNRYTGIGVNSVTVNSAQLVGGAGTVNLLAGLAELTEIPRIGYSYYAWLEAVQAASGTCTWFGDAGISNQIQSGMIGVVLA